MQTPEFQRLYAGEARYVRRVLQGMGVRSADLDDVTQETFLTVYRLLPEFEQRAALRTWLYAVCWRIALAYHRRARSDGRVAEMTALAAASGTSEDIARLYASLDTVDPHCLDVLALHEIGGLSIAEVAELNGQARATVRRHVDRAKASVLRGLTFSRAGQGPPSERSGVRRFSRHTTDRDYVSSELCITRHPGAVFTRWRGPSFIHNLVHVDAMIAAAIRDTDGPVTFMSVIEPTSVPPDRESREYVRGMMEDYASRVSAAAFVPLLPSTFRVVPAIMNACIFLSRTRLDARFFTSEAPALQWLARRSPNTTLQALTSQLAATNRFEDAAPKQPAQPRTQPS